MSAADVQKDLEKCEKDIADQMDHFEMMREHMVRYIKPFAREKIKSLIEDGVKENPELTKALGKEQLSALKKKMMDTLSRSDEIVDSIYRDDALWPHIGYQPVSEDHARGEELLRGIPMSADRERMRSQAQREKEEQIYGGLRRILGHAGKLLIEYGYEVELTDDPYSGSSWVLQNGEIVCSGWRKFEAPKDMEGEIERYTQSFEILNHMLLRRERLKKELSTEAAKEEAAILWAEA